MRAGGMIEQLEGRRLLSASPGTTALAASTAPANTVVAATTIPKLKLTTYHGTVVSRDGTSNVAVHIDTFTHTGHFTATVTSYNADGSVSHGTLAGVVRSNLRISFSFDVTHSGGGHSIGTG